MKPRLSRGMVDFYIDKFSLNIQLRWPSFYFGDNKMLGIQARTSILFRWDYYDWACAINIFGFGIAIAFKSSWHESEIEYQQQIKESK